MSVWFRADDGLSQFAEPMGHFSTTSTAADLPCKTEGRPDTKAPTSGDGVGRFTFTCTPRVDKSEEMATHRNVLVPCDSNAQTPSCLLSLLMGPIEITPGQSSAIHSQDELPLLRRIKHLLLDPGGSFTRHIHPRE